MTQTTDISISVVIPTYNRAKVIERAINSALEQTHAIKEIIIVDDGSSDHTVALIQQLIAHNPLIKLEQNPTNKGAPYSRNRGASLASGDFIAFLDSDDKWLNTKLEQQALLMQKHDACAVFTNFVFLRGKHRKPGKVKEHIQLSDLFGRNILGGTSSVLVKKSAFEQVKGFTLELPSCQDWDLWLKLAQLTDLYCVNDALVEYHTDGDQRISTNTTKVIKGHNHIFNMVANLMQHSNVNKRQIQASHNLRLAEIYVKNLGQKKNCFFAMLKSIIQYPEPKILWGNLKLCYFLLRPIEGITKK